MLDTNRNIDLPPSSEGVRNLRQMKKAGESIVLTINGKVRLVVQDDPSYQMLESLVDRLDMLDALRESLKETNEGKGISLEQVKEEERQRYGISL